MKRGNASALCAGLLLACPPSISGAEGSSPVAIRVRELATGLAHPWSLAFLPGGELLISERNGGLRILGAHGLEPRPLAGVPAAFAEVDGGLLGLALHPDFSDNRWVYLCLSIGDAHANSTRVVRGRLVGRDLQSVTPIFTARPLKSGASHFGCRLLFAPDGKLLVTLGDGYDYRDRAQSLDNHFGKIVRLNDDGSIPSDNPFSSRLDRLTDIYTYGHRNVQGIAVHPDTGAIWAHEHGPKGGDEINVLKPGANYGWPRITYGIDYSGAIISDLTAAPGLEQPLLYWVPSIAPSGMDFYRGRRIPQWHGDLFVGALAARELRRIDLEGERIVAQESLLVDRRERIREVRSGPDGYLYLLTDDADGKVLRLEPEPAAASR
jgi:glucose/arabinose dehydrogenase